MVLPVVVPQAPRRHVSRPLDGGRWYERGDHHKACDGVTMPEFNAVRKAKKAAEEAGKAQDKQVVADRIALSRPETCVPKEQGPLFDSGSANMWVWASFPQHGNPMVWTPEFASVRTDKLRIPRKSQVIVTECEDVHFSGRTGFKHYLTPYPPATRDFPVVKITIKQEMTVVDEFLLPGDMFGDFTSTGTTGPYRDEQGLDYVPSKTHKGVGLCADANAFEDGQKREQVCGSAKLSEVCQYQGGRCQLLGQFRPPAGVAALAVPYPQISSTPSARVYFQAEGLSSVALVRRLHAILTPYEPTESLHGQAEASPPRRTEPTSEELAATTKLLSQVRDREHLYVVIIDTDSAYFDQTAALYRYYVTTLGMGTDQVILACSHSSAETQKEQSVHDACSYTGSYVTKKMLDYVMAGEPIKACGPDIRLPSGHLQGDRVDCSRVLPKSSENRVMLFIGGHGTMAGRKQNFVGSSESYVQDYFGAEMISEALNRNIGSTFYAALYVQDSCFSSSTTSRLFDDLGGLVSAGS